MVIVSPEEDETAWQPIVHQVALDGTLLCRHEAAPGEGIAHGGPATSTCLLCNQIYMAAADLGLSIIRNQQFRDLLADALQIDQRGPGNRHAAFYAGLAARLAERDKPR